MKTSPKYIPNDQFNFFEMVDNYQKGLVEHGLTLTNGNITKAADMFRMNRSTLHKMIARYRINYKDFINHNMVKNQEWDLIEEIKDALIEAEGNQAQAAKDMEVTKAILYYNIRKHDINAAEYLPNCPECKGVKLNYCEKAGQLKCPGCNEYFLRKDI